MISVKKMEEMIGLLLTIGVIISSFLVLVGGFLYLFQHGGENMNFELLQAKTYSISFKQVFQSLLVLSPNGIIELGLFALVLTQLLRVVLLIVFYIFQQDYWFSVISLFILSILIYSTLFQS